MPGRSIVAGLAVALALTTAGPWGEARGGSAPAATETPSVTVTAARRGRVDAGPSAEVRDFVAAHATPASGPTGQLARWREAICPAAFGLPPAFDAFVVRRVGEVAKSVGAKVDANSGCAPNVRILFTTEPQKLLDAVRTQKPDLLGYHYVAQLRRLSRVARPIQAWYMTATVGANGLATLDDSMDATPGGVPGSRFTQQLSSEIVAVLIVVDAEAASRRPVGGVADVIAFLALAQAQLSETCGRLASVTELMAPDCEIRARPDGMTDGDLAFLKGLYTTDPRALLSVQKQGVAERMQRDVVGK